MKKKPANPQKSPSLDELVTKLLEHAALPAECAELMDMKLDNVRNYCRRGLLEGAIRFGNEWLIPRSTIKQYLEKSRGKPGRPAKETEE